MIIKKIEDCEEYLISGNNSLSLRGSLIFISIISFISLFIAISFMFKGYWVILPFAGIEMILLAVMLLYCCHNNSMCERIRIFEDKVNISSKYRKNKGFFEVNKYWASVVLSKPKYKGYPHRLFIRYKGKEMEIGVMLEDKERLKLAAMLNTSLKKGIK
ncbi:MAG: hypothetical protein CMD72_00105 [Gammaproteobacteria bacterium]|nr:hypothetical protein [Gammaproteobacteria bacterium]|tara:strand:+ start:5297 stop:5773 length:477 start_codon:yes stop_codon:yes gene_type:complete